MRIRSEKRLSALKKIYASDEHPFLVCKTCGVTTDKVIKRHSNTLRKSPDRKRQKTWRRIVKPCLLRKAIYHHKIVKAKEIFFSYVMLSCIARRHKITVRRRPFSARLVKEIK